MNAAVWVQLGVGLATIIVAFLVVRNGVRNTTAVDESARRAEWWKRTQWAIDLALSEEAKRQEVGIRALDELMRSPLAQEADRVVARAAASALLAVSAEAGGIELDLRSLDDRS